MTRSSDLNDVPQQLVARAQAGDAASLDDLVAFAWPHAYRFAHSQIRDAETAKDVAQDACMTLAASLSQLRDPNAFRSWFLRIVARRVYRHARARQPCEYVLALLQPERDERVVDIVDAVHRLPPKLRIVIALVAMHDMSSQELSDTLGIPAGTARYRLSVARSLLRARLATEPIFPKLVAEGVL